MKILKNAFMFLIFALLSVNIYAEINPKVGEMATINVGESLMVSGAEYPAYVIVDYSAIKDYYKNGEDVYYKNGQLEKNLITENGITGYKFVYAFSHSYGSHYNPDFVKIIGDPYTISTTDGTNYEIGGHIINSNSIISSSKTIIDMNSGFTYTIIFTGYQDKEIIAFSYREFSDGSARPAFTIDLSFLISNKLITFKDIEFAILELKGNTLSYRRIK
jgi:hypothetical protein